MSRKLTIFAKIEKKKITCTMPALILWIALHMKPKIYSEKIHVIKSKSKPMGKCLWQLYF